MQENEFEKKLQQKMEVLQVQPAEEVWEKVKAAVAQKKRKRRVALLFAVAGVLLAGLFMADSLSLFNKKQEIAIAKSETMVTPTAKGQKRAPAHTNNENTIVAIAPEQKAIITSDEDKNKSIQNNQPVTVATPIKNTAVNNSLIPVENATNKTKQQQITKRNTKASTKVTVINAQPVAYDQEENVSAAIPKSSLSENDISTVPGNTKADIEKDISLNATTHIKHKEIKLQEAANNITKEQQEKKTSKQKWGIGFSFSAGMSSAEYNNTDKSIAFEADGLGTTGSPVAAPGTYYYPSAAKQGFGFIVGIQVYRTLSHKIKLTTGIQYQQYSTSQKIGASFSPTVNAVRNFSYGGTNTYTNRYQYLSVPIGLSAHLFDIGKKEISFDAGLTISRLLKTNALSFDTATGYYFQNQSAFNKTFIGLSASMSINLSAKNKPAFYIGPQFYYSVTPLSNTGMYANTHSSFIGIRLQKNITR